MPILLRFWRTLTHPLLIVVAIATVALVYFAHLALPQLPSSLANDALAADAWRQTTAATLLMGRLLGALGLNDLAGSLGVRILLPFVVIILLLSLADRLHLALATRRLQPPTEPLPTVRSKDWQCRPEDESEPDPLDSIYQRRQTFSGDDGADEIIVVDSNQNRLWLTLGIELGLLVGVLSLLLNLRLGWQVDGIGLEPGGSASLRPYSNNTLQLDAAGQMLRLCCQPQRSISVGITKSWGHSFAIRNVQQAPALQIRVLQNGTPLQVQAIEQGGTLSPVLLLRFPQARSERTVAIPARNLVLRAVAANNGGYLVEVLDATGAMRLSQEISAAADLSLDDLTFSLAPTHYLTLSVSRRPWLWLLWPALGLSLVGGVTRWYYPYSRAGFKYNAGGIGVRWQPQAGALFALNDRFPSESEANLE